MKDFESAFLGLILAGLLMMAIGVGLMMSLARVRAPETRLSLAERQAVERAPAYAASRDNDLSTTAGRRAPGRKG
jgi:hypothetical protein